jgi:hypothetical protein
MHYYNEEYLLPWWLKHHKKYFDHGILIDYDSTDLSTKICKEVCPTWEIIKTRNQNFDAIQLDVEIMEIEQRVKDWRIVLNTTEFLIGDYEWLYSTDQRRFVVKSYIMADKAGSTDNNPSYGENLWDKHYWGYFDNNYRKGRLLNRDPSRYNPGRHFTDYNTDKLCILWYAFAPWNEQTKKRKLQIQNKIPDSNYAAGMGCHHRIDDYHLNQSYLSHASNVKDLRDLITNTVK